MIHNMQNQFTIALCGLGHIAQKHLAAIQDNPSLELIACVDTNPQVREQTSQTLNIPVYASLEDLQSQHPSLDLLALCTPSGLHVEQTLWAASKGWHIVSEKPLATSLADGKSMLEACINHKVNLFLVHQLRYNPTILAIKNAIDQGHFGKIYLVTSEVFWNRPQEYFDSVPWRGSKHMDGGAYLNQACHFIDLMVWLLGDVTRVQSMMRTLARDIETEDTGLIQLEFANQTLASIAVTLLTHSKNLRGSLSIIGEKGSVILEGPCLDKVAVWDIPGEKPVHVSPGHHAFYNEVIASLQGTSTIAVTGEEGYKTLEIIMAAHESSAKGKEILL